MSSSVRAVIFISYAHADEPEKPTEGEVQWLSFVRTFLQPAVKDGIFDLWADRHMSGGAKWEKEIEDKLRACDIFILLVSAHSMASNYVVDKEIAIIRERQTKGEDVHFYPLLLRPTPKVALDKVSDFNLRPRDAKPFSAYSVNDREHHMTEAANEIAEIAERIAKQKGAAERRAAQSAAQPSLPPARLPFVHITGLPETAYERLVGRDAELKRLNEAWADRNTNILSLVAEGGAGKSALVNEWLKQMQADHYRGAEAVLGWSFYSQGSKERATSAEPFLNWALDKLGIKLDTTSATAKGEAIAEALAQRRVLLVLDGVEPLQHGLGTQQGELKDLGLRALLRRSAAMPPTDAHGLAVLTSRQAIKDIMRWKGGTAPVRDVEQLSDEAGAALLRDNGVWGTDRDLRAAARAFGGHPLALGLLASFLKETQFGDVRRRDNVRELLDDSENPRHDHAKRVMESYEREWLAGQPVPHAILHMVGLFERPASGDCLAALRGKPAISGLTDVIVGLDESAWQRAVARLREVRLLAPKDPTAPSELDCHPLVREWFGERLRQQNEPAWREAHGRLFEHLRDTTNEGSAPTLEQLAPLFQAIAHGCCAMRYEEALETIYWKRLCRRRQRGAPEYYVTRKLGAIASEMEALYWFFQKPYAVPASGLTARNRAFVLSEAAYDLRACGSFPEAIEAERAALQVEEAGGVARVASLSNIALMELYTGNIATAVQSAIRSVANAKARCLTNEIVDDLTIYAECCHAAGRIDDAEEAFLEAERLQATWQRRRPIMFSAPGHRYCELLLRQGKYRLVCDRTRQTIEWGRTTHSLVTRGGDILLLARAMLGLALSDSRSCADPDQRFDPSLLEAAIDTLVASSLVEVISPGYLTRATFRRSVGDWDGAARDLDEVKEIAEPGPMRLYLCDMVLERARLAFARIEAFAPLNGPIDGSPPKPEPPSEAEHKSLHKEGAKQLAIAADYVSKCGYHRRDEELAELEEVRDGKRRFADLPPRV
jgi:hypothetical protein